MRPIAGNSAAEAKAMAEELKRTKAALEKLRRDVNIIGLSLLVALLCAFLLM
jgi:hypothetical protein